MTSRLQGGAVLPSGELLQDLKKTEKPTELDDTNLSHVLHNTEAGLLEVNIDHPLGADHTDREDGAHGNNLRTVVVITLKPLNPFLRVLETDCGLTHRPQLFDGLDLLTFMYETHDLLERVVGNRNLARIPVTRTR